MSMMMADIFVKAFILLGLMKLMAKDEADLDFGKVAFAVVLISVSSMAVEFALFPYINAGFILVNVGIVMVVLMKLCWLSAKKAFQVTVPFMLICGLIYFGKMFLLVSANQAVDAAGGTIPEQDRMEGLQIIQEINESTARMDGATEEQIAEMRKDFDDTIEELDADDPKMPKLFGFLKKKDDGEEAPATDKPKSKRRAPSADDGTARVLPMAGSLEGAEAKARLHVSATMKGRDGRYLAAVNGDLLEVGDTASVEYNDTLYRWKLVKVTKDGAEWEELPVKTFAPPPEPTTAP